MTAVVAATLVALSTAQAGAGAGPSSPADHGPSESACAHRDNNTASKLLECIRSTDLWRHLSTFQSIADANPGPDGHPSRNSGEPGYKASVDYVARLMRAAGYKVTVQPYTFFYFSYVGTPTLREVSPTSHDYTLVTDWQPGESQGTANAAIQPVGGIILPPTPTPTSASGCTAADFAGFTPGRVALIQRGTCNFGVKVTNAQAAGASGVIVFNEGNPGRTGVPGGGALVDADGNRVNPTIPVAFATFANGTDLLNQYNTAVAGATALPTVQIGVKAIVDPNRLDYNVIADSPHGDPNHTVVVDAHLDAIFGAGILDNASGSATILDIAQMIRKVHTTNRLRFVWFGGEELGLLGSKFYVNNLSPTELGKISYDLDADVTSTPNYIVGVLDPAGVNFSTRTVTTQFPPAVYQPSQIARDQGIGYFNSIGKNHELISPDGTDAFTFNMAGVPASGVLTGQDCCKNPQDVSLFGGTLGNFEGNLGTTDGGCVDNAFRWCDNLSNNDPNVFTFMSKGFANMVFDMAFHRFDSGSGRPATHAPAAHAGTDNHGSAS
jgi:Peptidase family M28/PA domain